MIKNTSPYPIARRGFMLVLSSPSGTGKTTIARKVVEKESDLQLSISFTTRPKRDSEIEGKDYYFVGEDSFLQMIKLGQFLEYAHVYGYHYGTPKDSLESQLSAGVDILFDIDWQGTQQLRQISPVDLVSIFLLPPSLGALEERLRKRGEDSDETIGKRMSKASEELSHWSEYNYIVINQTLEESVNAVRSIIQAERLKRRRQLGLAHFVNSLRGED